MKLLKVLKHSWHTSSEFRASVITTGIVIFTLATNIFSWIHIWPFAVHNPALRWTLQILALVVSIVVTFVVICGAWIGIVEGHRYIRDWYATALARYEQSEYARKEKEKKRQKDIKLQAILDGIYLEAQRPASPEEIERDPSLGVVYDPGINIF